MWPAGIVSLCPQCLSVMSSTTHCHYSRLDERWTRPVLHRTTISCSSCRFIAFKLKFHGISFLVASSWHIREMSLTVWRGNRACRTCRTRILRGATCPQQFVRVVLVEFREQHDKRTNRKHYTAWRVASWTGKSPDTPNTRDILEHLREDVARVGRVNEDVTRMLRGNCSRRIPAIRATQLKKR